MSEASEIMQEMAGRLFGEIATPDALRMSEEGGWNAAAWTQVEDLGLPLALVPEEADGVGLSWADAGHLVRLAGASALPLPLAETMLANHLLARCGLPLAEGPAMLAPVHTGEAGFTLEREGSGWRLRGQARRVPWAARAAQIVVLATHGADHHAVRLDRAALTIVAGANLAGEPRDDISIDAMVAAEQVAPVPADVSTEMIQLWGACLRTAAIAGAGSAVLNLTVSYANERVQFGRPIGKYQAIQQMLAVLAGQVAACAGAAALAASGLDEGEPLSVAIGKARVGEAVGVIASIAHQAHGAIGFTHEHSLHFLTKRLWSWREEFGNEVQWQRIIGQRMARSGADGLWPLIASL